MADNKAYEKKVAELLYKTGRLQDREVEKILVLLEQLRRQLTDTVAASEWQVWRIKEMKAAVNAATEQFRLAYAASQEGALANMWEAGQDLIAAPLAEAGFYVSISQIPRTALEVMQAYSGDLIGGLSADIRKKVTNEIIMGVMGGKGQTEVMKAIGLNLKESGIMKGIGARAEAITRTETGRINSLAREARIQATIEAAPEIEWRKKWHSSGKLHPRYPHKMLDQVTVPIDDNFLGYIPYPHAPGLSAAETINCGCTHTLVAADWDDVPDNGPVVYHERAIYN
ncbi:MAG: phage minor head protein [Thermodesulfobacteriota bacterium]